MKSLIVYIDNHTPCCGALIRENAMTGKIFCRKCTKELQIITIVQVKCKPPLHA